MADNETTFDINLRAKADTQQARSEIDELFAQIKTGVADALKGEGASPEFIAKAMNAYDELKQEMDTASGSAEQLAAKIDAVAQKLSVAAEAEQRRITQLKLGMQEALREKDLQQEAIELTRRRRQEDQLNSELAELASKKRIAELQMQRELEKSVAQARQMSAEQRIQREVMGQGAYDPREEVTRLRQVEGATDRVTQAKRRLGGSIGETAMQMAYFVDDAQYGLRGIMNNIPMLISSLGLGAGLAGVLGIAAVAVNFLWDKFSDAKEASKDTEELKQRMEAATTAINAAADATREGFNAALTEYLEQLREATQLWAAQEQSIQNAKRYTDELAKAELETAKAKLEIQRQNELAGAKTEEQRAGINSRYDFAGGMLDRDAREASFVRAEQAKRLEINSQRARTRDAEDARNAGQQEIGALEADSQQIIGGIGQQSDQARKRQQALLAQAGVDYLDGLGRDLTAAENERRNKFIAQREQANLTQAEDEAALRTGKGLTFEGAKNDAKAAGDERSLKQYTEAEEMLKSNAAARAQIAEALKAADDEILKLKLQAGDLEREMLLLQKQQQAARLKAAADATKKANDDAVKLQQTNAKQTAQKAENDALEAENAGDFVGAARIRNQAAAPAPGADAEEVRREKMAADKRLRDAQAKQQEADNLTQSRGLGEKAGNLGGNLGAAGKDLKQAADKLKDGGTEAELDALAESVRELAPVLLERFAGQDKKFSDMLRDIQLLKDQVRNATTRR